MNIVVLLGGMSPERDISLRSGENVANILRNRGHHVITIDTAEPHFIDHLLNSHADCVFPVLHGEGGEDGNIQGFLNVLGFPYVGSDVRASVICMDKYLTKLVAIDNGIPTPRYTYIYDPDNVPPYENVIKTIGNPFIVKPCNTGSTIGLSLVGNEDDYNTALQNAFQFSTRLLFEEFIDGLEVTVGAYSLDGDIGTLPPIWVVKPDKVFDYGTKYTAGGAKHVYDIPLDSKPLNELLSNTKKICNVVGIRGVVRLDFIVKDQTSYLLEINSIPGMTSESLVPDEILHMGNDFGEFLEELLKDAL